MRPSYPDLTLPALSIRQPWAWLIVRPDLVDEPFRTAARALGHIKDIENRGWSTSFRGRFLVHAALTFDVDGYAWVREAWPELRMPERRAFDVGGVIGTAAVADCVRESDSPWFFGPCGLVLRDSKPTRFVPGRGRLGFFAFKPEEA